MALVFDGEQQEELLAAAAFLVDVLANAVVEVARERAVEPVEPVDASAIIAKLAELAGNLEVMTVIREALGAAGVKKLRDLPDEDLRVLAARLLPERGADGAA